MFKLLFSMGIALFVTFSSALASFSSSSCSNASATVKFTSFRSWNHANDESKVEVNGKLFIISATNTATLKTIKTIEVIKPNRMMQITTLVARATLKGITEDGEIIERNDLVICSNANGI